MEPNAKPTATTSEEGQPQSFIVKIWVEETLEENGTARWSGLITHVPGGERRYFRDLSDIGIFILPYLEAMRMRSGWRWRLWKWLFRLSN